MISKYQIFILTIFFTLKQCLQPDSINILSRGEIYNDNTNTLFYEDNITVFNINKFGIPISNFRATLTGWIQTGTSTNLNNYQSKIQIFNSNLPKEKLIFFGNNSTHFILRQDVSNTQSRCTCELQHKTSTNYRFVVSILQNSSGLQLSLTLMLPDGSTLSCQKTDQNFINLSSKTLLLSVQIQKPADQQQYLYSYEKMGGITLISNYYFARDATSTNLNEEKFLLNFNPSGLQLFFFRFSYEQRDCNCLVDASENQLQGKFSKSFGVLEGVGAGGYFIYSFTQNQELVFQKSRVRFGQPMDNFYNSLNVNNQSNSYSFMSVILSFWIWADPNVQSFQILQYAFPNNQLLVKIKKNINNQDFQLIITYSSIEYSLTSTLSSNQYYHITLTINSVYTDLYLNGSFVSKIYINLATLFTQETSNGTIKLGGENLPINSIAQLSQVRMFSSSSILTSQSSVTDSLIINCLTLVQEKGNYTCILCVSGYFLNDQGKCVSGCNSSTEKQLNPVRYCAQKCSYRCKTCSDSDPLICLSCESQRDLKGTTCMCINETFEDYRSNICKGTKRLTAGYEIGQFTFKGESSLTVVFKNAFSTIPSVVFSVLGFSNTFGKVGTFQVTATTSLTNMVVNPGITGTFYLHVQYFAYEPSNKFYSSSFVSVGLLTASGEYTITDFGPYYKGNDTSKFNTHIFLGGYASNLLSSSSLVDISIKSDKKTIVINVASILIPQGPTIYYLLTPPEITSYPVRMAFGSNTVQYNSYAYEKYYLSKIPLSILNSGDTWGYDMMYSINLFEIPLFNFEYFKYQPNEITIGSTGQAYQNYELYFHANNLFSAGVTATVMIEVFNDSICGVKDYYTTTCLYCKKFGFNPNTGCTTCLNTFQLNGNGDCIVPDGKYYDSLTNSCLDCNPSCSKCNSKDQCSQCKGQLTLNIYGLCSCSSVSEWFDLNGNCFSCHASCASCKDNSSCTACKNGLTLNTSTNLCECPVDQWLNISTSVCQSCYITCGSCSSSKSASSENCKSCKSGRVLDQGNCKCNSPDQRLFEDDIRCSQDSTATLNIFLSNDYLNIVIEFGINIEPLFSISTKSYSICESLFDSQTLILLGSGASCETLNQSVTITLDGTARIVQGDLIVFKTNSLKFTYNQVTITQFLRNQVRMVGLPFPSKIKLSNILQAQNYCSKQTAKIEQIQFDGKRGIKLLKWSVLSSTPTDTKAIQILTQTISEANLNQQKQIDIFLPMVSQDLSITIQLIWNLWVGQSGSEMFSILIERKKILRVNHVFTSLAPFYVYKKVEILHSISCEICDEKGKIYKINEPLSIRIKNTQLGIDSTFSQYTNNEIKTAIRAFSMVSDLTYPIQATFTVESDPSITVSDDVDLYIKPSELTVKILGGSRYASYRNSFNINGYFKDFEMQSSNSNHGIQITWACTDISNGTPCVDSKGQQIVLTQGAEKQSIEKFSFQPFSVAQFEVLGKKSRVEGSTTYTRTGSDKIIVFITEMDIPPLEVSIPDELIIDSTINPNQLIHAEMIYDNTVNIDQLYYSGAILYKNEVVGIIKFEYSKIRFQVWDYFDGYTSDEVDIQVRFSVYNPQYVLPSLATLTFKLNFPPSNCKLNIQQNSLYSLDLPIEISFDGCIDTDLPISFQFFYYSSGNEFILEKQNYLQIQRKQLSDLTQDVNKIITHLPSGKIEILAQAVDSRGAISNSTLTVDLQLKDYTPSDYLLFIDDFISSIQNLAPEMYITNLNLLSEDILLRENGMTSIKQQLNNKKIEIIKELQSSSSILSTSYFYQLALQSVTKLLSSPLELQLANQQSQLTLISDYLQTLYQKCTSSEISQQRYEKCVQDLYLSFNQLDSLSTISLASNPTLNAQYVSLTTELGDMLNLYAIPNENAIRFKGKNIQMISQKITKKNLHLYTGIYSESQNLRRLLVDDKSNSSSDNIQTSIYDVSYKTYGINFYQNDETFKAYTNQILNVTKENALMFPVINPQILEQDSKKSYDPQNGIIHSFKASNTNKNLTCFAKQDKTQWNTQTCSTRKNEKTKEIQCICPELFPTTIIEEISDLFENNKNIDTVFGEGGIENLSNFQNFYLYWVFWIVLGQTVIFLILVFYGMKLDASFLFDSIPLPLRKQSKQVNEQAKVSISKVFPLNQRKPSARSFQQNQIQSTFTIREEDENKGLDEDSPAKPKKLSPQNIQLINLDNLETDRDQDDNNLNTNDNNDNHENTTDENDNNIQSTKGFSKRKIGSATSLAMVNPKRTRKTKSFFDRDLQIIRNASQISTQTTIGLKKDSLENVQSPTTLNFDQKNEKKSARTIKFNSSIKIPSLLKLNEKELDTPLSTVNKEKKFGSVSTLPDNHTILDTENDKSKNDTPPNRSKFQRKNKKVNMFRYANEISEEEKEKLTKISKIRYYAHFHEFLSIFLVFRYEISRAVRFIVFYIRYEHTLAISILFGIKKSLVQTIFVSLASSISILIISLIIEALLTQKKLIKNLGVFFSLGLTLLYAYIILAIVSGEEPEQSNEIIWTYLQFLITDILIIQNLTAFIFGIFAKSVVNSSRLENDFLYKLFNLLKLNVIISTLLK